MSTYYLLLHLISYLLWVFPNYRPTSTLTREQLPESPGLIAPVSTIQIECPYPALPITPHAKLSPPFPAPYPFHTHPSHFPHPSYPPPFPILQIIYPQHKERPFPHELEPDFIKRPQPLTHHQRQAPSQTAPQTSPAQPQTPRRASAGSRCSAR